MCQSCGSGSTWIALFLEAGSGSALKSKLRIFRGSGPWMLTMKGLEAQMESWRVYSIDQWSDSHYFDEKQDPDPR